MRNVRSASNIHNSRPGLQLLLAPPGRPHQLEPTDGGQVGVGVTNVVQQGFGNRWVSDGVEFFWTPAALTAAMSWAVSHEPYRGEVRKLLREYVSVRLDAIRPESLSQSISRSEELQSQLWSQAATVGEKNPGSIVVGLFIGSLNEVIDLHAKRLALGMRNRIPSPIWAALYFMAVLGTAAMGYHAGLAGSGRSLAIVALVLAFSAVMTLIADLDRPQAGLLRVSQQTMIDLQRTLLSSSR